MEVVRIAQPLSEAALEYAMGEFESASDDVPELRVGARARFVALRIVESVGSPWKGKVMVVVDGSLLPDDWELRRLDLVTRARRA